MRMSGTNPNAMQVRGKCSIEHFRRRKVEIDVLSLDFHAKDVQRVVFASQTCAILEREGLLVQRAGNFGSAGLIAENAPRKDERLLVRAHILSGIPLAAAGKPEDRDLALTVFDGGAAVVRKVAHTADSDPGARFVVLVLIPVLGDGAKLGGQDLR